MRISKIVSGGQTGADRGGWHAAIRCDLPYGGWVPKGRRSEDGVIPLAYGELRETESDDYLPRTQANVEDSDATLILCRGEPTGGTLKTLEFAQNSKRPFLVVDLDQPADIVVQAIVAWLTSIRHPAQGVLNVAGPRASKSPGIEQTVTERLIDALTALAPVGAAAQSTPRGIR
jgi:hypothetical protein